MKINEFKYMTKNATMKTAFNFLHSKQIGHSKVQDIIYKGLKIQPYLKDRNFTTKEKQFLFKLRTSMSDVKENSSSMFGNVNCNLYDGQRVQSV